MADNSVYLPTIPSGHVECTANVDNIRDADKPITTMVQTAIDSKMSKARFAVLNTLPPSPVEGLGMVFIPTLSLCKFGIDNKVYEMRDPVSGKILAQSESSLRPTIDIDDNGVSFLRFNGSWMVIGIQSSLIASSANKTTCMIVAKTQSSTTAHVELVPNTRATGFVANLPNSSNEVAFSHGHTTALKSTSASESYKGQLNCYYYVRDGNDAQVWVNGTKVGETSSQQGSLPSNGLMFLSPPQNSVTANMDFYGMAFFPKALTPTERKKMFLFSKRVFGV